MTRYQHASFSQITRRARILTLDKLLLLSIPAVDLLF